MQCFGLKRSFSTSPSAMSASSPGGRLAHHQGDRQAPFADQCGTIELGEVRRLVMDEFCPAQRDTRYATVIMDAERTRVPWVGHGNSQAAIRPFFESSSASDASRLRRWRWT